MTYRALLIFLGSLLTIGSFAQVSPKPGMIDASTYDFNENRLALSGSWIWYDNKLLDPSQLDDTGGVPVDFPGTWNERRSDGSGQGYATYALTIILPHGSTMLSLDLPQFYSSYVLYVNNKEIARNGTPGKTAATTVPQWRPQIVRLQPGSDTLRLALQIANFNHNKGGLKEPIYLGAESMFQQKQFLGTAGKAAAVASLFLLALAFVVIYFRTGRKIVVVYFSLLCITWAIRSVFSNDYLITQAYPGIDWSLLVRVEYISLFLEMIWAILFLCELFKNEANRVMKYVLVAFNLGFAIFTMVTQPVEFTRLLGLYLITAGVLLLYGAGVVLVALVNERRGATYLTVTVLLCLAIFSYDIFAYEGWASYNSLLFSAGYLVMFLLIGGALLLHLDIIKGTSSATTMLTYEDLYGKETES